MCSSKLQTEIALSTAESEYSALCSGMRALLPIRHMLLEIAEAFDIDLDRKTDISHVFEDNQACIAVATADPPRLTPRNKHWNVKHHWFCSKLSDEVVIKAVASVDQIADIFTKALPQEPFEHH